MHRQGSRYDGRGDSFRWICNVPMPRAGGVSPPQGTRRLRARSNRGPFNEQRVQSANDADTAGATRPRHTTGDKTKTARRARRPGGLRWLNGTSFQPDTAPASSEDEFEEEEEELPETEIILMKRSRRVVGRLDTPSTERFAPRSTLRRDAIPTPQKSPGGRMRLPLSAREPRPSSTVSPAGTG